MADELRSEGAPADFPTVSSEQLQEVARRIKRVFDPQRILLFGSHAFG